MQEGDWNGNLGESIEHGFSRWFLRQVGKGLKHFHLVFVYTDDFQHRYEEYFEELLFEDNFRARVGSESKAPVGAFIFSPDYPGRPVVGKRIMDLEKKAPGAGFQVWDVVERAINATTGGATLSWVHGEIIDTDNQYCDCVWPQTCQDCEGRLTYDRFTATVPEPILSQRHEADVLERALLAPNLLLREGEVISESIALHALLDQTEKSLNHARDVDMARYLPVLTHWKTGDDFDEVFDQYHDCLQQTGEGTDMCWVRGWQHTLPPDHPGSIRSAARALKSTVEILVHVDRILDKLDYVYKPRQPRDRTPMRVRI